MGGSGADAVAATPLRVRLQGETLAIPPSQASTPSSSGAVLTLLALTPADKALGGLAVGAILPREVLRAIVLPELVLNRPGRLLTKPAGLIALPFPVNLLYTS